MFTTNNRCTKKTWEEREAELLKGCKLLAIKDYSLTEYDDFLEDFIHNFLVQYNYKYSTAEIGNLGNQQCSSGRLRSLIDLFLICRYYFPDCTLKSVKDALYANYDILSFQTCSTVHRRVYWIKHGNVSKNNVTDTDELGLKMNDLINK